MSSAEPEVVGNGAEGSEEELPRMTLLDHLDELRRRILYSIIAIFVGFLGSWYFAPEIFHWLEKPFLAAVPEGEKLAFTDLPGPFMLYIKVALLTAIFVASPILLIQLWLFLRPGLYRRERRLFVPFVVFTTLFFVAGGYFGYLVAFPMVVKFLLGVGEGLATVFNPSSESINSPFFRFWDKLWEPLFFHCRLSFFNIGNYFKLISFFLSHHLPHLDFKAAFHAGLNSSAPKYTGLVFSSSPR